MKRKWWRRSQRPGLMKLNITYSSLWRCLQAKLNFKLNNVKIKCLMLFIYISNITYSHLTKKYKTITQCSFSCHIKTQIQLSEFNIFFKNIKYTFVPNYQKNQSVLFIVYKISEFYLNSVSVQTVLVNCGKCQCDVKSASTPLLWCAQVIASLFLQPIIFPT